MGTWESGKVLRNPEFSPIPDQGETRTLARAAWGGYMAPVCTLPHAQWGLCMGVVVDTAQDRHTELQAAVQEAGQGSQGLGRTPQQGHTQATWEQ